MFYVGYLSTDDLNRRFRQDHHVGPSTRKMITVARSLRQAGCRVVLVSPLLNSPPGGRLAEVIRVAGLPYIRTFSSGARGFKRLVSAWGLLCFAMITARPADVVLLYNYSPEYIPLACILKARGIGTFLDLEDAPRSDELGARGLMNRVSFAVVRRLVHHKIVTVSNRLARALGLRESLAIYGTSEIDYAAVNHQPLTHARVNVLYGGAILPDTGYDLFRAAVLDICARAPEAPLSFHVSGMFDQGKLSSLQSEVQNSSTMSIQLYRDLPAAAYHKLLASMDVGLCLKLPSREMGQTTFPSKVIEYTAAGLLLCTTRVSDVPDIFSSDEAVILATECPRELSDTLLMIASDPAAYRPRASAGKQLVADKFSPESVGRALRGFLVGP